LDHRSPFETDRRSKPFDQDTQSLAKPLFNIGLGDLIEELRTVKFWVTGWWAVILGVWKVCGDKDSRISPARCEI
jgi:hypothetical protein